MFFLSNLDFWCAMSTIEIGETFHSFVYTRTSSTDNWRVWSDKIIKLKLWNTSGDGYNALEIAVQKKYINVVDVVCMFGADLVMHDWVSNRFKDNIIICFDICMRSRAHGFMPGWWWGPVSYLFSFHVCGVFVQCLLCDITYIQTCS
jgi:hypothetical protein